MFDALFVMPICSDVYAETLKVTQINPTMFRNSITAVGNNTFAVFDGRSQWKYNGPDFAPKCNLDQFSVSQIYSSE